MRILFVENRYKTALWELVGRHFQNEGHQIYWIVQNPLFKPSFGEVYVLPFPKKKSASAEKTALPEALLKVRSSNRALNYFQLEDDGFILHYHQLIEDLIDQIQPDVAFGETTAFHELLVSNSCQSRSIYYLNPSSCRYPRGRFSFYKYDTLDPFGGSKETYSEAELQEIVTSITHRQVQPDYMVKQKSPVSRAELIADKIRLVRAYYKGEHYNTPSPFVKRTLTKNNRANVQEWDRIATPLEEITEKLGVLFPLQMQPEANIDVWGYPNSNQKKVAQGILDNLDEDAVLIIKPNPKSKYEIDHALLDFIQSNSEKVFALEHSSKMEDALKKTDLVVTVTGTISLECILSNIPVVMYGYGLQTKQNNCLQISSTNELKEAIEKVRSGTFPKNTEAENRAFMDELVKTSYNGIIGDGFMGKNHLNNPDNRKKVFAAFDDVMSALSAKE